MTQYLVMPDLEAVVRKKLADAGYSAYSSVPNSPVWPIMVIHRAGGSPAVRQYLDMGRIQVDVWGGAKGDTTSVPKSQIHDLAQQARVKILELEGTKVTVPVGAWISAVDDSVGITWLPDPDTGRDRYFFVMDIYGRSLLPGE